MTDEFCLSDKIIRFEEGRNIVNVKDYCDVIVKKDVKEFIKRQLEYQDLKIKLAKESKDISLDEMNAIINCCIDNKMKMKFDAGASLC